MLSLGVVVGGTLYFAYGVLPHQYYLPIGFGVILVAGVLAYTILARIVEL